MIKWTLIMVLSGYGMAIDSVEFTSEVACVQARVLVLQETRVNQAVCVPNTVKLTPMREE